VHCILIIQLLSGQHLIVPHKKTTSMEINYETYGIPQDCEKKIYKISSVSDHGILCKVRLPHWQCSIYVKFVEDMQTGFKLMSTCMLTQKSNTVTIT